MLKRMLQTIPVLFMLISMASGVWAQPAEFTYQTLIDADNDAATGCNVVLAGGVVFAGAEQVVTVVVDQATAVAVRVEEQVCGAGGVLSAPEVMGPGEWPVGLNLGVAQSDAVEGPPMGLHGNRIRLGFVARANGNEDVLLTANGAADGAPLLVQAQREAVTIPTVGFLGAGILILTLGAVGMRFLRRRASPLAAGCVFVISGLLAVRLAMACVPDGLLDDWAGLSRLGEDAVGDALPDDDPAADIAAAFAVFDGERLCFRIDVVDLELRGIGLEKRTNDLDADAPTGPVLLTDREVTWTYEVTNAGNVPLTGVTVTDDQGVEVTCPDDSLDPGESMICTASGITAPGQYANLGTATGTPPAGPDVTATDPSHYFGLVSDIDIEKRTNGEDADDPPGPIVALGGAVTWTYEVTNTSNLVLTDIVVEDNQGVAVSCPTDALDPGESMTCTASGTASAGQYDNLGIATGMLPLGVPVTGSDPSHYFGEAAAISLEKLTNGEDADLPPGPVVLEGRAIAWTYTVSNTGNVPLTGVSVTDDQGVEVTCPGSWLDAGEYMTCTASGVASEGQYSNMGTATGTSPLGVIVQDVDPSHYHGDTP